MKFEINKVKVSSKSIQFPKGYTWEVREMTGKIIVDCFHTKREASNLVKSLLLINNFKSDGLGRVGNNTIANLLPLKDKYYFLFN